MTHPTITPEVTPDIPDDADLTDLHERASAMFSTLKTLDVPEEKTTDEDLEAAATLALSYAENPREVGKALTDARAATLGEAVVREVTGILTEFGTRIAREGEKIRNTCTNKLLLETDNPDPRVRLRAIEMLGKMPEVGMFVERKEIHVHHSNSPLTDQIREKLVTLKQQSDGTFEQVKESDSDIDEVYDAVRARHGKHL